MVSVRRFAIPAAVIALGAGVASPALAEPHIGGFQSFVGLVNGVRDRAIIQVVCAGPIGPGRTGPAVSGQRVSVSVSPALAGPGLTGRTGHVIVVRFSDDPFALVVLSTFGTPAPLPAGLRLPCGGSGSVRFAPRPSTSTARADVVEVAYQNIAL